MAAWLQGVKGPGVRSIPIPSEGRREQAINGITRSRDGPLDPSPTRKRSGSTLAAALLGARARRRGLSRLRGVAPEVQRLRPAAPPDLHVDLERRAGGVVEEKGLVGEPRLAEGEAVEGAKEESPRGVVLGLLHRHLRHVAGEIARTFRVLRPGEDEGDENARRGLAQFARGQA